jgi:hypothetical protein
MRHCGISDEQLFAFVDGREDELVDHVAECAECQDFLAEVWEGELRTNIVGPVVRQIRLELFLIDMAKTAGAVAGRMGRAVAAYTFGIEPGPGGGEAVG